MPKCGDCYCWHPAYQEDNPKEWLDAAYHDPDCGVRAMDDWEGLLEDYIFEGDVMYQRLPDGGLFPVSTYSKYPEPYVGAAGWAGLQKPTLKPLPQDPHKFAESVLDAATQEELWEAWEGQGMVTPVEKPKELEKPAEEKVLAPHRMYSWADFKSKFPRYASIPDPYPTYTKSGYQGTTYTYTPPKAPYDHVDRAKWPNLWRFLVKFHFLPNAHKDTKFVTDSVAKEHVKHGTSDPVKDALNKEAEFYMGEN